MENIKEPSKKEIIQDLFEQAQRKGKLFEAIADAFKMKSISVKTNWFYTGSYPDDKQDKIIEVMKLFIENQKATA